MKKYDLACAPCTDNILVRLKEVKNSILNDSLRELRSTLDSHANLSLHQAYTHLRSFFFQDHVVHVYCHVEK